MLEQIKTDGTENGLTASTKINAGLSQTNKNTVDIETINKSLDKVYEFVKASNVDIPTEQVWVRLGELNVPTHSAGVFEYKMCLTFTLDSTTNSALFRFSIDGGTTWVDFQQEAKDVNDVTPFSYFFPMVKSANDGLQLILETSKTATADVMTVIFSDIIIDQK